MNYYSNPYGLDRLNEKEKLAKEREEKRELLLHEMVKELKNIGKRLEKIEKKLFD